MLILNYLKTFIRHHRRLTLVISGFATLGIIFFILLAPRPGSPSPSVPTISITSTPTPLVTARYTPPLSVDLSRAINDVSLTQTVSYTLSSDAPNLSPSSAFLSEFGLPTQPEVIDTEFIKIRTWRGDDFYLSYNLPSQQITFGITNANQITTRGTFQTPQALTQKAVIYLKALGLFADEITFSLENFAYFTDKYEWPEPVTESAAQYLNLFLTPVIAGLPVYQQEVAFVTASFDRGNKLIKLQIVHPLFYLPPGQTVTVTGVDQLSTRPTNQFFRLLVKKETGLDYLTNAQDISRLTPDRLSLGYFFDKGSLQPVFLLRSDSYLYATDATQ